MPSHKRLETLVHRVDETRLTVDNPQGVPVTLFANRDVPVQLDAIEQLLDLVSIQETVEQLVPFWGNDARSLRRVVLTPDFHRGSGIPIGTVAETEGFVMPQAVGHDVCCGMRLLITDLSRDELSA